MRCDDPLDPNGARPMTHPPRPDVQAFFETFDRAGSALDTPTLASCFNDVFLNLDPASATPVSREALLNALPMREKLFGSLGVDALELDTVTDTPLDAIHVLVRTTWSVRFTPGVTAAPLTLSSTFLLRHADDGWRIVVYLNHQDVTAAIRSSTGG
jgi:hypothetical protein